jgi:ribonuclease P protein component
VDDWLRFGQVVPKRHARRAVTRNLIRRQARAAFEQHGRSLDAGDWFLRLKAPFSIAQFPSAASAALKTAVRAELERLFLAAGRS